MVQELFQKQKQCFYEMSHSNNMQPGTWTNKLHVAVYFRERVKVNAFCMQFYFALDLQDFALVIENKQNLKILADNL